MPEKEPLAKHVADLHRKLDALTEAVAVVRRAVDTGSPSDRDLPNLKPTEVAALLGISLRTLNELASTGELTPTWIRGARRFSRRQLDDFVRRSQRAHQPRPR